MQASVMWVPSVGWGERFGDRVGVTTRPATVIGTGKVGAPTNWACPDPDARWTVTVQSAAADT